MTGKATLLVSQEGGRRIAQAIARAEAGTSGEIMVMVSARAGFYRSVVALAALASGLVVPWPLIVFTGWTAAEIMVAQAAFVVVILAAGLNERVRMALVPSGIRRNRAREAARQAFWSHGLSRTQGRTGVLLFLAVAERHAEIVTDAAIGDRIRADAWDAILSDLLAALARGEAEAGLVRAVERIGQRLAVSFPAGPDDANELPNRVIVTD